MATKKVKPRAPKYAPLTVDGADYLVRTNPPIGVFADLQDDDLTKLIRAISALVKEHPMVMDDGITPRPPAEWDREELKAFIEAYGEVLSALPPD